MVLRPILVVLAAASFSLAGCLGASDSPHDPSVEADEPGSEPADPAPAQPPLDETFEASPGLAGAPRLEQSGCDSFYTGYNVDEEWASTRLPFGLSPWKNEDGPWFLVKTWSCRSAESDSAGSFTGPAMVYYIAVVAEAPYASPDVGFSWYPLEVLGPADLMSLFATWGFTTATPGDVALDWETIGPGIVAEVSAGGKGTVDARIALTSFMESGSFTVRYFAGDGNRVTGAVDIVVHRHTAGEGMGVASLDGEHAYRPGALPGKAMYQGWAEDAVSYTWTPVTFLGE